MPAGDHTGPAGQGPRTGRAAGYCAGYEMPGYMNPIPGRGRGGGFGRGFGGGGRGWRHRFFATGLTGWRRGERGRGWRGFDSVPATEPPFAAEADRRRVSLGADLSFPGEGEAERPASARPGGPRSSPEEELQRLRADLDCLEQSAAQMRRRIAQLSAQEPQKPEA